MNLSKRDQAKANKLLKRMVADLEDLLGCMKELRDTDRDLKVVLGGPLGQIKLESLPPKTEGLARKALVLGNAIEDFMS